MICSRSSPAVCEDLEGKFPAAQADSEKCRQRTPGEREGVERHCRKELSESSREIGSSSLNALPSQVDKPFVGDAWLRVTLVGVRGWFLIAEREDLGRGARSTPYSFHSLPVFAKFQSRLAARSRAGRDASIVGLLHIIADPTYGQNEDERVAWLWRQTQEYYACEGSADRLFSLTKSMIKPKKGAIELAGSGSQMRALGGFLLSVGELLGASSVC